MAIIRKTGKIHTGLTEASIQDLLYWWTLRKGHRWQVPNAYLYTWESDFLTVTRKGFIHEFEIKVTRSDFKADAQKITKHDIVSTGSRALTEQEQFGLCYSDRNLDRITGERPNYFWYVCPENMITVPELPPYAGLITVAQSTYSGFNQITDVVKSAPRMHKETITMKQIGTILNCIYYRYWRFRRTLSETELLDKEQLHVPGPDNAEAHDTLTIAD